MTRQLNRLMSNQPTHHDARGQDSAGQGSATQGWWPMLNVQVEMVEAEPASTFTQRLVQAAKDKVSQGHCHVLKAPHAQAPAVHPGAFGVFCSYASLHAATHARHARIAGTTQGPHGLLLRGTHLEEHD